MQAIVQDALGEPADVLKVIDVKDRGAVFSRWFSDLSPEEQADDVASAFAVAAALPSVFKTGGVYGLDEVRDAVAAVEAPGRDGFVFVRP